VKIEILPSALEDLYAGHQFYEMQAKGIGDYFFDSLFSDIDSLVLFAGVHRKVYGFYRMLSRRFPFAVYYKTDGNVAVVWRVLDLRRDPERIRQELQ
jgi:plasmid stabilization system protein ParE